MIAADYTILIVMAIAAVIAAGSFAIMARYLFDRGLADPNALAPNLMVLYRSYLVHTKKESGRIGRVFWFHSISAGIFISTGVVYALGRWILPHIS